MCNGIPCVKPGEKDERAKDRIEEHEWKTGTVKEQITKDLKKPGASEKLCYYSIGFRYFDVRLLSVNV